MTSYKPDYGFYNHQGPQMLTRVILVYGSFRMSANPDHNFFLLRIPNGRCAWSKKIAPAIQRVIKTVIKPDWKGFDRWKGYSIDHWNTDGVADFEGEAMWHSGKYTRFVWDGTNVVPC